MAFDLSQETLERTWLGTLASEKSWPDREINLERAMRLGERLDGHMVSGHVDGEGRILGIEDVGDGGREFRFEVAQELSHYLIEKGSITIDGISLTVVGPTGCEFKVAVIPVTLALTSLGRARVGDAVNLEVDMVGKWIERLLVAR
ncbi:MAG: riboflavin synthase [Planctomycetota bacterium]|jgi:riboflavin synthase